MDKSERYLKEIAKNTADIAKELKKMNRGNLYFDGHPNTDENGDEIKFTIKNQAMTAEKHLNNHTKGCDALSLRH